MITEQVIARLVMMNHAQRYRYLEKGEVIRAGDEVQNDDGTWKAAVCVGQTAPDPSYTSHRLYRRSSNQEKSNG